MEHDREIKRLKRERADIDAAIADFERLEAASSPSKGKPPRKTNAYQHGKLIYMERKRG
jgi:hypothetical protein